MIFVSVGTQKFSFERLLREMDCLIEKKCICEEVFAQIGHSNYIPQNYRYEKFISEDVFERKIKECRLLIAHGGVGTITRGLKLNKPVIIVPRMEKYHEHVDNHQIEIATAFQNRQFALACEDIKELGDCIAEVDNRAFVEYSFSYAGVARCIRKFILDAEGK